MAFFHHQLLLVQEMETVQMEKKKEIKHFLHDHPLYLVQDQEDYDKQNLVCDGCRKRLAYPSYGCDVCDFYLHESCSQIQRDLQHHFHPCPLTLVARLGYTCNSCFAEDISGFRFRCQQCDFDLDLKCALEPTTEESYQVDGEIRHFTHRHPLIQLSCPNKEISCSICRKQLCSDDVTYGCSICKDFFLHQSCMMSITQKIDRHPFHPEHPLILLTTPSYKCKGCNKEGSGLVYRCRQCYLHLDVECALLPTASCESAKQIQHFSHPHPLDHLMICDQIVGSSSTKLQPRCSVCRQSSPTPPDFGCNRHGCNFYLHRSCAMEFPQTIQDHPFHPNHHLKFVQLGKSGYWRWCRVCWKFIGNEWAYSCVDCSRFKMHLNCSKLKPSISCNNHQHLFTLIKEGRKGHACLFCRKDCTALFLRCVTCDISFHIQCHPLAPKTVRHKYHHWHDLTYTASPLDYEVENYGRLDEYYCDFCEEPRPASNPVYCCMDCNLSADIRCVISQILPLVNGEGQSGTIDEEGSTDPELEKLTRHIKVLKTDVQQKESKKLELKAKVQELKSQLQAHEQELEEVDYNFFRLENKVRQLEGRIFKINATKL